MKRAYVFGHRNPDTDSVCSAIALAYLKNQIGQKCTPVILSAINDETRFVLNRFNVSEPSYLNDVKLQIKDVNYNRDLMIDEKESLYTTYKTMISNQISALSVIKDKKLVGIITLKDMAKDLILGRADELHTSYSNIISALEGEEVLKYDNEIKGHLIAVTYKSTTFINDVNITSNDILIVGDRHSVIEYAVMNKAKLIILVGSANMKDEHLKIAKENNVNVIRTKMNTLHAMKRINLCNYISNYIEDNEFTSIDENMYLSEFLELAKKLKHTHYPVSDRKGNCLGTLRISDINDVDKKRVILVDHNEEEQSIEGIEDADIIEIIDHHKIGNISTKAPINFRNMAVGSTCTIIYTLYTNLKIEIPDDVKGLLLCGILSDTLLFKSPTSTSLDLSIATTLSSELKVNYNNLAMEMFKSASNYKNVKNKEDVLYKDFKKFNINDEMVGVGNVSTLNAEDLLKEKEEYISLLNKEAESKNYKVLILMITDIIDNGSYILFNDDAKVILEASFNKDKINQGEFLKGYLSRKKQLIPDLMDAMEK